MGEIAEMMLDGTLCEGCGIYMGDSYGYPRRCDDCAIDETPANRPHEPIGKKLLKRLIRVRDMTDNSGGMYSGDWYEFAPAMHAKLIKRGYIEVYQPHNQVHKARVVVTDYGREAINNAKT